MKIFTNNNIRFLGVKLVKGLMLFVALVAAVILVFSLGSIAGKFFAKLLY